MPHYLIQVAYNTTVVAGMVKEPQNRIEKVTPAIEALGGRVKCGYFAFGEHDVVIIWRDAGQRQRRCVRAGGRRRQDRLFRYDHGSSHAGGGRRGDEASDSSYKPAPG